MSSPPLVTFHVFGVTRGRVPLAVARMGLDRRHLRRTPGLSFWKLLGTGDGRTFDLRDADPRTWGLLAVWDDVRAANRFYTKSPVLRRWLRLSDESWHGNLRPTAARGRWSGQEPFGRPNPETSDGPVAVITRARLRPSRIRRFWAAVPQVNADLQEDPGLWFSLGIGEAPVGVQGTFSVWESADALQRFAYRGAAHRHVIRRTHAEGWYAEELFARFRVVASTGTVGGRDPVATRPRHLPVEPGGGGEAASSP